MRFLLLIILLLAAGCNPRQTTDRGEFTDDEYQKTYEQKAEGLERILGKPADMVGHAIIPFDAGGTVDMYYYPNGTVKGTGLATMELIRPDGSGPVPNRTGTFELVAFTKLPYTSDTTDANLFNLIVLRTCRTFTDIGNFSTQNKLEPGETMEIPMDDEIKCIVFDEYRPEGKIFMIGERKHGLLLVLEVFKSEMEYAMLNGSNALILKLKEKGYYPYSDLDREPVVGSMF